MLKLNFDKVFWVLNFPLCKSLYRVDTVVDIWSYNCRA